MSKATELLKQAGTKREEARSRRGLARLTSAGKPERQLEQQAHELERQAAQLEEEAKRVRSEGPRRRRNVRGAGAPRR